MNNKKPKDIYEYKKWLKEKHRIEISDRTETYYNSVTSRIKPDFEKSDFWIKLTENLREYDGEYLTKTGYHLLTSGFEPELHIKSFDSFLLKTFRKNIIENKRWPDEPEGRWVLPNNWYSKINDIIRTLFEVKYLDGVEFIISKVKSICEKHSMEFRVFLEATEEGYYAAHLYTRQEFEIPKVTWDTEKVYVSIEIQITTQLQEIIRKLLHKYYEDRRKRIVNEEGIKWQWNYKSDEFVANYLGHILHYVEGMIMEIREKQKETIT
ncbi:MAG: hypothetical protein IIA61_03925 [Candidatus Marinimicrobia bacterium]|nr:hypothetical protein [Candidatus Neomarinimicrobiota bacterium]